MNNQELSLYEQFKDLSQEGLNEEFRNACKKGDLKSVKYLLTSHELNEHADIHDDNDKGFRWACDNGHLDIVKYLSSSPELREHAEIHADYDYGFRWSCANKHKYLETVKYFIFDLNIKITKHIADLLKEDEYREIKNMFAIRELNQSLGKELSSNNISKKKIKL